MSNYTFTVKSTGRTITARVVSIPEYRAMSKSKAAIAKQFNVPEGHALTALHVSASLVEPALSVGDALKLHQETPGYYAEIAGPITERFTAVPQVWEKQVMSIIKKSKGSIRTTAKNAMKKPEPRKSSHTPPAPVPGLPRMVPFRRK